MLTANTETMGREVETRNNISTRQRRKGPSAVPVSRAPKQFFTLASRFSSSDWDYLRNAVS
jgi:hypothetical protein